jgi:hypothetical protein
MRMSTAGNSWAIISGGNKGISFKFNYSLFDGNLVLWFMGGEKISKEITGYAKRKPLVAVDHDGHDLGCHTGRMRRGPRGQEE